MILPWKLEFLLHQLRWSNYRKTSAILSSPLVYYASLIALAKNSKRVSPWTFTLKSGKEIKINHFMSSYNFNEIFVEKRYDEAFGLIKTDFPKILDIGANTGLFVLRVKSLFPLANVVAYEPERRNIEHLQALIQENELDHVKLHKEAIGNTDGLATLHYNDKNIGGHSVVKSFGTNQAQTVPIKHIHKLLEEHLVFDLVKIDVEGAEFEILMALEPRHVPQLPLIIFETELPMFRKKRLFAHLISLGYHVRPSKKVYIAEIIKKTVLQKWW